MATRDHFLQVADVDVGVNLSGSQTPVAEQLLNLPDVGLALKQVRGERMAQRVRCDVFRDAGAFRSFLDDPHDVVIIQRPAAARGDKQ